MLTEACAGRRPLAGPFKRCAPPPCRPPGNGGCLAAAARLRPSSIHAGIASGPAPAFTAQSHGLARERLIRLARAGALEEPGHLGQQICPAAR